MSPLTWIGAAVSLCACATSGPGATDLERVPAGEWGGPSVQLTVSESAARIEFDCAHGTLDGPLRLDGEGRFDVRGTFVREGGPERPEEKGEPVRYAGKTDGESMQLTVTKEGGEAIGTFSLRKGGATRLRKCL
jgi:hypothetical protein